MIGRGNNETRARCIKRPLFAKQTYRPSGWLFCTLWHIFDKNTFRKKYLVLRKRVYASLWQGVLGLPKKLRPRRG